MNEEKPNIAFEIAFETLPTGKQHVSFSESTVWKQCSWRHKLQQIDKVDLSVPSPIPSFGTSVHAACEHFLKTRVMDIGIAHRELDKIWKESGFTEDINPWKAKATSICNDVPAFMDKEFPNWTFIEAEHFLYEQIGNHPHAFKGFIDGVVECDGKRKDQRLIWLIDWKTCGWGWPADKKRDPNVTRQLVLYKHFWCQKNPNVDFKNVRCAFVLLKRDGKDGDRCARVDVSVGDTTRQKSLKVINNMITSVKRGMFLKNKHNCKWCEYAGTVHCP